MTETFVDPTKRYRLYFDETGTGDLKAYRKDPNQRYLSITGIVLRQDVHDGVFTKALTELKLRIFDDPFIVLHRRDIIAQKEPFAALENDDVRADFDVSIAKLVGRLRGPAFTVSIDKKAHLEKYKVWRFDPYHYVLTCIVERYVLWLKRTGRVGDVMGEARGPYHDGKLRRAFRRMHKHGSEFVTKDEVQARLLTHELKLEPKETNVAALQIADLLAHPAHRTFKQLKLGQPIPNDYGATLARTLTKIYDRHPRKLTIEGCGRKWLP